VVVQSDLEPFNEVSSKAEVIDSRLPRSPGRPSEELEIEKVIDILLERGVELGSMPRPTAFAAVRKCAASELKLDINVGFSDPVLQRFLFRRFGPRR
jgi:hypothetical protein